MPFYFNLSYRPNSTHKHESKMLIEHNNRSTEDKPNNVDHILQFFLSSKDREWCALRQSTGCISQQSLSQHQIRQPSKCHTHPSKTASKVNTSQQKNPSSRFLASISSIISGIHISDIHIHTWEREKPLLGCTNQSDHEECVRWDDDEMNIISLQLPWSNPSFSIFSSSKVSIPSSWTTRWGHRVKFPREWKGGF